MQMANESSVVNPSNKTATSPAAQEGDPVR